MEKSVRAECNTESPGGPISPDKRDPPFRSHRDCRPAGYSSDNHSKNSNKSSMLTHYEFEFDYDYDYESPTASLSSSFSSFEMDRNSSNSDNDSSIIKEEDHLRQNSDLKDERSRSCTIRKKPTAGVLAVEGSRMTEATKSIALVEEEPKLQRMIKHEDQLNRAATKFKEQRDKFQEEKDRLRTKRDEARRELEKCKESHVTQSKRLAEWNEHLQSQQKNRIGSQEQQKVLLEELQAERDALPEAVAMVQQQQQQQQQQISKEEFSALYVRIREDEAKWLEFLSTSSEQKDAKQKDDLSKLDIISKKLKAEQEFLKLKNKEFTQLEVLYQSTITELRSIDITMIAKKEEMDAEIKRDRELHKHVCEKHEQVLKLKNDKVCWAKTKILTMKAEFKSTREKLTSMEESMALLKEELKNRKRNDDIVHADPKLENGRLQTEIKELHTQVESYLANLALQQE